MGCNKANGGGEVIGKRIVQEHYGSKVGLTLFECNPYIYEKHIPTEYLVTVEKCDTDGKDCDSKEISVSKIVFKKARIGDHLSR